MGQSIQVQTTDNSVGPNKPLEAWVFNQARASRTMTRFAPIAHCDTNMDQILACPSALWSAHVSNTCQTQHMDTYLVSRAFMLPWLTIESNL